MKNVITTMRLEEAIDEIKYKIIATMNKINKINAFERISQDLSLNIDNGINELVHHLVDLCDIKLCSALINMFFTARAYLGNKHQGILRMLDGK